VRWIAQLYDWLGKNASVTDPEFPLSPPPSHGTEQLRPGYGSRHPDLDALLSSRTPAAVDRVVWGGDLELEVAAYPKPAPLPSALVTSVRCIVRVGDRIVVCQIPDGPQHVWPGGRREAGEAYRATARREVYEETGWLIDEQDLRALGFLHLRFVLPRPDDHPYPHPDFLQLIYTAPAHQHAADHSTWTDIEGWEQGHSLLTPTELHATGLQAIQRAFLDILPAPGR